MKSIFIITKGYPTYSKEVVAYHKSLVSHLTDREIRELSSKFRFICSTI